ncbi:MAG: FKBP-type peptidyl-prolyl cis-trans isomerase [Chloroflexi bacterium]|nr:FKBP-type peptidyl-prolyl cis-trans isomerase [Chloroflexota bacterium]
MTLALAAACGSGGNGSKTPASKTPVGGPTQITGGVRPAQSSAATSTAATPAATQPLSDGNAPGIPQLTGTIQTSSTGLRYIDEKVGGGAQPKAGNNVTVHYTGWLTNGTKFDSSVDRGQPFSFPLGQGRVISGWDEGVASMKVGGKRRLIIPANLAYGAAGRPPTIPQNATLIFDVELLSIN